MKFEAVIATIKDKSDPYYQLGLFYAAETHAHLGFSFYKQGDLDRAEEQFVKAVEENDPLPGPALSPGRYLREAGAPRACHRMS